MAIYEPRSWLSGESSPGGRGHRISSLQTEETSLHTRAVVFVPAAGADERDPVSLSPCALDRGAPSEDCGFIDPSGGSVARSRASSGSPQAASARKKERSEGQ